MGSQLSQCQKHIFILLNLLIKPINVNMPVIYMIKNDLWAFKITYRQWLKQQQSVHNYCCSCLHLWNTCFQFPNSNTGNQKILQLVSDFLKKGRELPLKDKHTLFWEIIFHPQLVTFLDWYLTWVVWLKAFQLRAAPHSFTHSHLEAAQNNHSLIYGLNWVLPKMADHFPLLPQARVDSCKQASFHHVQILIRVPGFSFETEDPYFRWVCSHELCVCVYFVDTLTVSEYHSS